MEIEYGYVVVKEHYTDDSYHDIVCICFTKEKAKEESERIQKDIDPEHNEWRVSFKALVEIVR